MFCVMCNIQFKDTSELNIHLREQHIYEVDFSSYLTEIDLVEGMFSIIGFELFCLERIKDTICNVSRSRFSGRILLNSK